MELKSNINRISPSRCAVRKETGVLRYRLLLLLLLLLLNGAPALARPRPPLMRFRNLTLIDNW
jgi:hypothetical protein